jgi:hypothetical protein
LYSVFDHEADAGDVYECAGEDIWFVDLGVNLMVEDMMMDAAGQV